MGKKVSGFVLIMALFIAISAWAEETILNFYPKDVSVKYGQTFVVEVVASSQENIYGAAYDVVFDETLLQIVSVEEGAFLKEFATVFADNFSSGSKAANMKGNLIIGQAQLGQAPGVNGGGVLAKIVFKVITSKPTFTTVLFRHAGLNMAVGYYYIKEPTLKTNFVGVKINP